MHSENENFRLSTGNFPLLTFKIMQTILKKADWIVFVGMLALLLCSCAPPPFEVFLSPNPDFGKSKTAPSVTVQPQTPSGTSASIQGVDKIAAQLTDSLAEAQAHLSSGETRLQEQNLLEAIREFELARTLIEERVDPSLLYIQQTMKIQGWSTVFSDQQIQTIRNKRADMLSRLNQAYNVQALYTRWRTQEHIRTLQEASKFELRPVQAYQKYPRSVLAVEQRQRVHYSPTALKLDFNLSTDEIDRSITRFQQRGSEFRGCLERAERYFPVVAEILASYGIPEELAQIALIESGFQPSADSETGDAGLWQISRSLARSHGLEVSSARDDRKNLDASTNAVGRYLAHLHNRFGSWELAILGYKMGEQALQETINRVGSYEFRYIEQQLGRNAREREFLAKLVAAMTIAQNPGYYGFDASLPNITGQMPIMTEPPAVTVMQ